MRARLLFHPSPNPYPHPNPVSNPVCLQVRSVSGAGVFDVVYDNGDHEQMGEQDLLAVFATMKKEEAGRRRREASSARRRRATNGAIARKRRRR